MGLGKKTVPTQSFEESAAGISQQFLLDLEDVRQAYEDKPASLTTLFNAMTDAKDRRKDDVVWTVLAAIFIWPLAALPGYFIYKHTQTINNIGHNVRDEIFRMKALPPKPDPKSLPPAPGPSL